MVGTRSFLRMGTNADENAKTVIDFVALQLQQKTARVNEVFEKYGIHASYTMRPWALVFTHDKTSFDSAFELKLAEDSAPEQRIWLELIRICYVENIHHLRAVLCSLHIREHLPKQSGTDILSWIQTERDGQPPCIIVVVDLLRLLLTKEATENPYTDKIYVYLQKDRMSQILALLGETCRYLTVHARKVWEEPFGCKTELTTDLLVTDNGCLDDIPDDGLPNHESSSQIEMLKRIYRIITHYMTQLM